MTCGQNTRLRLFSFSYCPDTIILTNTTLSLIASQACNAMASTFLAQFSNSAVVLVVVNLDWKR